MKWIIANGCFVCKYMQPRIYDKEFIATAGLANIVLNHLDWHIESRGMKIVRYADDFVILCKTHAEAEKALAVAKTLLEEGMELELSMVWIYSVFFFLDFWFREKFVL